MVTALMTAIASTAPASVATAPRPGSRPYVRSARLTISDMAGHAAAMARDPDRDLE